MLEWTIEEEIAFAELSDALMSDEDKAWWDEFDADAAEHLRLLALQDSYYKWGKQHDKYKERKAAND